MTFERPLVSAIIPVFNGEAFLAEAINSVLAQTYSPLECVVVDDGSADRTPAILESFGDRVRGVRRRHHGIAAARNAGAGAARGSFLAFLDADDIWEPTKLEQQMTLLGRRPELGLAYCGFIDADRDGRPVHAVPVATPAEALRNVLLLEDPSLGLGSTALIPREAFEAVGGFDESLPTCEDADLAWRLATRFPMAPVSAHLVCYRRHAAQHHELHPGFEYAWKRVLHGAFTSGLLPREVQVLERQARANLALMLAYRLRHERPLYAARQLGEAFCRAPVRTMRWLGRSRRLRPWRARSAGQIARG